MIIIQCDKCGVAIDLAKETPLTNGKFHVCEACVRRYAVDNALEVDPDDDDELAIYDDAIHSITEGQRKAMFAIGREIGLMDANQIKKFLGIESISTLSEKEAFLSLRKLDDKKKQMEELNHV